jgi:hypothetical protein
MTCLQNTGIYDVVLEDESEAKYSFYRMNQPEGQ